MPRSTLLDFFEDVAHIDAPYLVHDDGYRVRQATYGELADAVRAFAARLAAEGIAPDDKVVIWSENRIEWVAALWGCLAARVVLVPVDFHASVDLVRRIATVVRAKAILVGSEVAAPSDLPAPTWSLADVIAFGAGADRRHAPDRPQPEVSPSTLAEIIFTSGATADPKGVTITHRNILANIVPIEREVRKYKRYARPFHPLRFLNLLPLSHMFGQSMAAFVPPMLDGTVVFSHGYSPSEILRQIKSRRISVLVCVPKVLDVLREYVEREWPLTTDVDTLEGRHWGWRWWRYRTVHRRFGWKFWCVIVGAAPLDPALEAFWRKLGFLVVQGYGLTETAPVVTLNHPLRAARGTVGRPMAGVDVTIAPDGEVLVRGDNVTTGYYQAEGAAPMPSPFDDGWFHTGDIGEIDASGRLRIKGRKKEMIVTAQGLNVFPEDVERVLKSQSGVADAGVVGTRADGEERVHAVLVLTPGADLKTIVRNANAQLEDHQRVWSSSAWPGDRLPRTDGTEKLKRRELQQWVAGETGTAPASKPTGTTVEDVVARFAGDRGVDSATTLDEIGLGSLDRVEMLMALEAAFHVTLNEAVLAETKTVGDLAALVKHPAPGPTVAGQIDATREASSGDPIPFPWWNRTRLSWLVRRLSLPTWILPLARVFMQLRVEGLEHLAGVTGPAIFAANHLSHMDGPAILIALPSRWRYRMAPAMAKEFFAAHFDRKRFGVKAWFLNSLNYYLACQFFNAFPLPQREAGTRQTLRYIGEVAGSGYSVLIFPEGRRADTGEIAEFRPGVGMMAARLELPVVPVRIDGLDRVLHPSWRFPKRGPVRVAFGAPLTLRGDDYTALAADIREAVAGL